MKRIERPAAGEYAPYTLAYIDLVPSDELVLQHLQDDVQAVTDLFLTQSDEKLTTPCAQGEWSMKEILAHITDTERVFAYRALRFARNDATELAGFDQDYYANYAGANARSGADLLEEFTAVRIATLALFNSFEEAAWKRSGVANGHPLSVRATAYIIVGHARHHIESIKQNYFAQG